MKPVFLDLIFSNLLECVLSNMEVPFILHRIVILATLKLFLDVFFPDRKSQGANIHKKSMELILAQKKTNIN